MPIGRSGSHTDRAIVAPSQMAAGNFPPWGLAQRATHTTSFPGAPACRGGHAHAGSGGLSPAWGRDKPGTRCRRTPWRRTRGARQEDGNVGPRDQLTAPLGGRLPLPGRRNDAGDMKGWFHPTDTVHTVEVKPALQYARSRLSCVSVGKGIRPIARSVGRLRNAGCPCACDLNQKHNVCQSPYTLRRIIVLWHPRQR